MFSRLTSPFIRIVTDLPAISMSLPTSIASSPDEVDAVQHKSDTTTVSRTPLPDSCLQEAQYGDTCPQIPERDIPVELLDLIFVHADRHTMTALARCSHQFYDITVRYLYRHIPPLPLPRTIICLRTLSKDTEHAKSLASHVRTYELGDMDSLNADRTRTLLKPFYRILRLALHNMHNLTDLSFFLFGATSDLLLDCPFALTKLSSACDFDDTFARFLATQRSIRTAFFCGQFTRGTYVSKLCLPNLSRVSASPLILAAVVPGRPVKEVELCLIHPFLFNEDVLSVTIRILSYSKGPLSSLQIISHLTETPETVLGALGTIPECLGSLSALALHAVSGSITNDFLSGLPPLLSAFTSLKSLVLLSKNRYDALHDHTITRHLPSTIHSTCSSLECVSLPNATYIRHKKYNWINILDLEKMLLEKEQVLMKREKEVKEREKVLAIGRRALEERERRLLEQVHELGTELEGISVSAEAGGSSAE
ncbi:uncharacterized protein STEHIDRAFT_171169 [Stereum hirsutum FP-91666 SS1]|uniref:uncharacterized protein n=1 Tax=Stereum hirsutum (strain FP-91666) TaxID=721885 RepID=UPI000444A1A5|nr:uncharacterized protein STEHIDRAFT_171169 [Stereum hirsutum FP-91666 SS1]EIM83066.1 hypothetical protein STEHIDRAFT_171169 [Stereum hirsutum FP-91666 SS1]